MNNKLTNSNIVVYVLSVLLKWQKVQKYNNIKWSTFVFMLKRISSVRKFQY